MSKRPAIDLVEALPLDGDNLLTAARRLVRFLRIDDEGHGGLISRDTVRACDTLARHVELIEKVIRHVHANHDNKDGP